jgi:hypothetical protein
VAAACAALPLAGCVIDWSSLEQSLAPSDDAGGGLDVVVPDDAAGLDTSGPEDTSTSPDAGTDAACGTPQLLVNEVQTDGAGGASDEFVEIFNAGPCMVSLTGWTIQYSSAAASSPSEIWKGGAPDQISAGGYAVVGGTAFAGSTVIGKLSGGSNGSLAKAGGGVGLLAPLASTATDSVAWATITASTHPFMRPTTGPPAPNPPSSQAIARLPNGTNTNSSSVDFKVTTTPTPGKTNK